MLLGQMLPRATPRVLVDVVAIAVAGVLAATVALMLVACSPGQTKACDTRPRQPAVTLEGFGNPVIDTFTVSYCDAFPIEHHVQVWMEWTQTPADEMSWAPLTGLQGEFTECSDIPTAHGVECHFTVPCQDVADGWYRTRVTVLWTDPSGSHTYSPPERPFQEIRCP